jgi:hypothetical protein
MSRIRAVHPSIGILVCYALAWLLSGCTVNDRTAQPPLGSCSLTLSADSNDTDTVAEVIRSEGKLVVAQDIDALMALWADGSYIADAKNTPATQADDQYWRDKDAIRHRYVRIVFPGAPSAVTPADFAVSLNGDHAEVLATTTIGAEVAKAGDRWTLVRQNGCWLIESLTYNLEAK